MSFLSDSQAVPLSQVGLCVLWLSCYTVSTTKILYFLGSVPEIGSLSTGCMSALSVVFSSLYLYFG